MYIFINVCCSDSVVTEEGKIALQGGKSQYITTLLKKPHAQTCHLIHLPWKLTRF